MEEKEFLFAVMVKVAAPSPLDAHDRLYKLLCTPGDLGFSINSYAVTGEGYDKIKFIHTDEED